MTMFVSRQETASMNCSFDVGVMDILSKEKRSHIMSKIKGKDTKPEICVRKFLFSKGFRYRKNKTDLPGKPDIVLKKHNAIIMVNGCFWHGHANCAKFKMPKSNVDFWQTKILRNKERDMRNERDLSNLGWNVINVWECEIDEKMLERLAELIRRGKKAR